MDNQQRKKGKYKSKNTYDKYGKYTAKSVRIREATLNAVLAKSGKAKSSID
jgi:hypothetical protein